ncbi:SphA family protein [Marinobacter sp. 1Y8]
MKLIHADSAPEMALQKAGWGGGGKRKQLAVALLAAMIPLAATHAEEGASGHYFPGSYSSFMDGVSPTDALIVRANLFSYSGSIDASRAVPIAGMTALDVDVDTDALGVTMFWRPDWGTINDRWNYAMSATIPFVDLKVSADVQSTAVPGTVVRRSDSESGIGDTVLMPLMLNYHASDDLNINFRTTFYAPTGDYKVGRLANTGKNFWTVEPTVALMYLGQKNGIEGSLFLGADFNQENPDTDYKSGTQVHLGGTVAQHFPLWGGLAGAGVTGYWYQQVEGDSGSGANLGAFKARAQGLGPTVSWVKSVGKDQVLAELKWINEFNVNKRPEGNTLFLKAMYKFQ